MADQQPDQAVDVLQAWLARTGQAPESAVPRADRTRPLRASHAQRGMWLAHEAAGDDRRSLTAPHAYRLTGPLNVAALAAALNAIAARHEVLRTNFTVHEGELLQVVAESASLHLAPEEIAGQADLNGAVRALIRLPFDLEHDPLLRVRLYRLAPTEHVLVAVFHHIANDGWSMDVFHHELAALYEAATDLPSVTDPQALADFAGLPELSVQYSDFAAWQRALADDANEYEAALAYWRDHLADVPDLLDLPTDQPRPQTRSSSGDRVEFTIPPATCAAVASLATRSGATPFAVQFAAFQAVLAAWSGQDDSVIGITTASRTLPETEALIGFFVNILPIRAALSPEQTFADFLDCTRRNLIDAYKQDDLPFELLLEQLAVPRSAGHNPLVQVTVASHQELTAPLALAGLTVEHLAPQGLDVQEDLTLYLTSGAHGVRCDLAFRTDLFERGTILELSRAYLRLLDLAAADPGLPLRTLAERAAVPAPARAVIAQGAVILPEQATEAVPGTAPHGVVEELVAAVWSELLGCGPLTREANFFTEGGTSLAASRVANRLSEEIGVRVPVRAVFRHSGLSALAAHLTDLIREAAKSEAGTSRGERGGQS